MGLGKALFTCTSLARLLRGLTGKLECLQKCCFIHRKYSKTNKYVILLSFAYAQLDWYVSMIQKARSKEDRRLPARCRCVCLAVRKDPWHVLCIYTFMFCVCVKGLSVFFIMPSILTLLSSVEKYCVFIYHCLIKMVGRSSLINPGWR